MLKRKLSTDTAAGGVEAAAKASISHREDVRSCTAVPGETLLTRLDPRQTDGRYAILESLADPGTAAPLHTHQEDEIFYILEGTLTFQLADERVEGRPGSMVFIPAGTPHSWKNRSNDTVRMLALFVPGGVGDLFRQIAGLDPTQIAHVAAQYGTVVLGPPIAD